MKKEYSYYTNKKITISINDKLFTFTIAKVLDLTDVHILFKDKFNQIKGFRFKDIIEITD